MTKQSYNNDVGDFHRKFGLPTSDHHEAGPRDVTPELLTYRMDFMQEELNEFTEAATLIDWDHGPSLEEHALMFDALVDLVYVALGTAHFLGYPWRDGWDEVQRANMAKERATSPEQSTRNSSFDVVKPDGWTPPDIGAVLRRAGF